MTNEELIAKEMERLRKIFNGDNDPSTDQLIQAYALTVDELE